MPQLSWLRFAFCGLLLLAGCLRQDVIPDVSPVDPVVDVAPTPQPAPVPVTDGLKVLVLYDSDALRSLPQSQVLALQSLELREWLESKHADYRIWDKSVDTSHASDFWKEAVKLPHDSLPWFWAARGGRGVNGPFSSTADIIKLIEPLTR